MTIFAYRVTRLVKLSISIFQHFGCEVITSYVSFQGVKVEDFHCRAHPQHWNTPGGHGYELRVNL